MNKPGSKVYSTSEAMDATTFDEAAAVCEARKGSRAAFESLVGAYQRRAYAIAYGFVGNREDALELAQESFARAYKAMHRFDTRMPFYPWLYRIIKNACLNHLAKRRRRGEVSLSALMESGYDPPARDSGPLEDAERGELRHAIAAALDLLSPDHQEILVLRHLQELSYAEIASCLGVPQGTVMSRLHAARRKLRGLLEQAPEAGTGSRERR